MHQVIDLQNFPPDMRRIAGAWYHWQATALRSIGKDIGTVRLPTGSAEYSFWLANPPRIDADGLLLDIGDVQYRARPFEDGWSLTKEERGIASERGVLRAFPDVEKYLLYLMGQLPRRTDYTSAPDYRWYQQGLDPRVRLEKTDPAAEYSYMFLFVDEEPTDRGYLGQMDAVTFSHPLVMSYEQIDATYREGLPNEWLSLDVEFIV